LDVIVGLKPDLPAAGKFANDGGTKQTRSMTVVGLQSDNQRPVNSQKITTPNKVEAWLYVGLQPDNQLQPDKELATSST
jgi:hypothetical protein